MDYGCSSKEGLHVQNHTTCGGQAHLLHIATLHFILQEKGSTRPSPAIEPVAINHNLLRKRHMSVLPMHVIADMSLSCIR